MLLIVGGALLAFWRHSDRRNPFLLYWGPYEVVLAITIASIGYPPIDTFTPAAATPLLLLGTLHNRNKRPAPRMVKVFEPFWQEDNNFVAENRGVGLGLPIARSYIEAQGGRIETKRGGERGTIFRVSLPLAEVDAAAPPCIAAS